MPSAELVAYVDHRKSGDLSCYIYSDMSRVADICALVFLRADLVGGNAEGARDLVDNALNGDLGRNVVVENIRDDLLSRRTGRESDV